MNAAQAHKQTQAGLRAQARFARLQQRDNIKRKKEQLIFERKQVPGFMTKIYAEIKKAAAGGQHEAYWSLNWHLSYETAVELMKARLEKKGFTVNVSFREGAEEVDCPGFSSTDFTMRWKKS